MQQHLPLFHKPDIQPTFVSDAPITLYHGAVNDFIATLPDEHVSLIVTSPPYNLGKDYEKRTSIETYLAQQAETIRELVRIVKPSGSICWQVGNFVEDGEIFPLDMYYYPIFKALGMQLRNRIVWHFGHGLHTTKRFSGRYETVLWFTKTDEYTFNLDPVRVPAKYPGKLSYKGANKGKPSGNPKGKNPSDVWEILCEEWDTGFLAIPNVKSNHPEKTIHPCQFPVELVERFVLALTNEGDVVYDPYAGVGSSLIAAVKYNRVAMGSEKESEYVAIARERIEKQVQGLLKTRAIGTPIYEPTGREKVAQIPDEWKHAE